MDTRSVARVAAHLRLPLGRGPRLIGDMAGMGLVVIHSMDGRSVLWQQGILGVPTSVAGGDQRLDRQVVLRAGSTAGPRVRADQ